MTRALSIFLSVALSGCTLILKPDRDAIAPDLDAGVDAGDGGGGVDAGDGGGGGCTHAPPLETTCEDGRDDDCDGQIDCDDTDCRGAAVCCRGAAEVEPVCFEDSLEWKRLPIGATEIQVEGGCEEDQARVTSFGVDGVTRALITDECQPISFGMQLEVQFRLEVACGLPPCDYAALSFAPLSTLVEGEPLLSELRAIVYADGTAAIERAGTVLGRVNTPFSGATPIRLRLVLEPGPGSMGRDVLFATARFDQGGHVESLLAREPILPLADLRCIGATGTEVGLYAAIEGLGDGVSVQGPFTRTEFQCSNPSQFILQEGIDTEGLEACAPGGVGAPAVVNYCREGCDDAGRDMRWELWVDASRDERFDESFDYIDFGVCGWAAEEAQLPATLSEWRGRTADAPPFLWESDPSSREPTLLPMAQHAERRVEQVAFAYAQRAIPESEVYAIYGGFMLTNVGERPGARRAILTPEQAGCRSVRDPLLLADWHEQDGGYSVGAAWLLFTCERDGQTRSIGAAHLDGDLELDDDVPIQTDILNASAGAYAERGVFAPEGFTETSGPDRIARVWFLARDSRGRVRLAYAQGRGHHTEGFPALTPYAANPILGGASDLLGGDCTRGCTLTGLSVTPSFVEGGNYQFFIARSRLTSTGPAHDLVPLLQPAPDDR